MSKFEHLLTRAALHAAAKEAMEEEKRIRPSDDVIAHDLRSRFAALTREREPFKAGDLVRQVKGLQAYGKCEPFVVVLSVDADEIARIVDACQRRSLAAQIMFPDMLIGSISDEDGDFVVFAVESRRFELYEDK